MSGLEILIAELEAYEHSMKFMMAGYSQTLPDGTEHFCCKICGHSPKLLLERLRMIAGEVQLENQKSGEKGASTGASPGPSEGRKEGKV